MFLHVGVDLYLFSQHSLQSQNKAIAYEESEFLSYKNKPSNLAVRCDYVTLKVMQVEVYKESSF